MDAVQLRSVSKCFGEKRAVDDLTFDVPRGCIHGFIGPNGSGKTTTLRMVMSIFRPDTGEVRVLDQPNPPAAKDRVGYLPEARGLYKKTKVRRLLRYYARLKNAGGGLDARIDEWLDRFGLREQDNQPVETLSKGMAQKVQFIATVIADPELIILDEPFSGLDPVNLEAVREAVIQLRDAGATIIFSTHDMAVAERMCDRILMIYQGRKVLDGTLEEIQAEYGQDTVRLRTSAGANALEGLPQLADIRDHGQLQEARLTGDSQALLAELLQRTEVHQFEITRPSLHDIFVRIANPQEEDADA